MKTIKLIAFSILMLFAMGLGDSSQLPSMSLKKLSPLLQNALFEDRANLSVMVLLENQADLSIAKTINSRSKRAKLLYDLLRENAEKSQAPLIARLNSRNSKFQRFYITNSIVLFDTDAETIHILAKHPEVRKIVLNSKFKGLPEKGIFRTLNSHRERGIGSNILDTKADQVWKEFDVQGEGIVIADSDTGVDWTHSALMKQYRGYSEETINHAYNWHDAIHEPIEGGSSCGYDVAIPCDDDGHGTHTTGTIVGDDHKENQIGMAPKAKWIACRNMDAGVGRPSTYIECFEWFFAPYPHGGDPMKDGDPEKAPHVINNSWGCPASEECVDAEILPVLKVLKEAGIMVVASAGNDGSSCKTINTPPAMHTEETLSVGAHSHYSGSIAFFSSRGPSKYDGGIGPDITAPGVNVRSCTLDNNYASWSGTSMAGPHVVGQVALLWSYDRRLIGQIDETIDLIRKSASPTTSSQSCGGISGSEIPNNTFGWGKIDAHKAIIMRASR